MQIAYSTITFILIITTIYSYGFFISNLICKKLKDDLFFNILSGYTFIGIIAVNFHFFFKINDFFSLTIIIIGLIIFIKNFLKLDLKKFQYLCLTISIFSPLFFAYSDHSIDANMYHHPYVSYLKSEKIIFGIANIQFRFGHISFLQYVQSTFTNNFLHEISLASINIIFYITFIFYFVFEIFKTRQISFIFLIKILIISFILIKFSRYREYGNDLIPLIVSIYFLIKLLDENLNSENSIQLFNLALPFAAFMFLHKISYVFVFLIFLPLIKFINFKKIKMEGFKPFKIFLILILPWLIKNYIVSSCLSYPIDISCFSNSLFELQGLAEPSNVAWLTEIWAKGFIDNPNWEKINLTEYSNNFNWLPTWLGGHFIKIIEIITPLIFIQIIFLFYLLLNKKKLLIFKKKKNFSKYFLNIFFANLFGLFLWFYNAPTFRYGSFYIILFFILSYILALNYFLKFKQSKNLIFFKMILLISLLFFIHKNLSRIHKSELSFFPETIKKENDYNIFNENDLNLLMPKNDDVCYFTKLICSHEIPNNLIEKKIGNYYIYTQ